jgi:uncharacterized protein YeaO (DUF488 family)
MIKTKSIYNPKEASDGVRVLVTRYYPRGIKKTHFDIWDRNLAPSKELLMDWKNGKLTEVSYTRRFLHEMGREESCGSIKNFAKMAETKTITFLCFEKEDGSFCHRHILKGLVEKVLSA